MDRYIVSLIIQGVLTLVLVVGMIWIVVNPNTGDEAVKAALAILGAATGFIFGRAVPMVNGNGEKK